MSDKKKHPIRIVARRTGLTPELVRAWERRYGAVEPARTPTGRRFYSDEDIERLRLMHRLSVSGRRIGEIAGLSGTDLAALVEEEATAARDLPVSDTSPGVNVAIQGKGGPWVEDCMEAVRHLDPPRLESALSRALLQLGSTTFMDEVVGPLLHSIGRQWERGRLDPYSEHLATGIIRQMISKMLVWTHADPSAPAIVVSTPAGQKHDVGAMLVATAAQAEGWRAIYLGPDLPARDIARAAEQAGARVVALSIIHPSDDPGLDAEISELSRRLSPEVALLAGGLAAHAYSRTLRRAGARILPDVAALLRALADIRAETGGSRAPAASAEEPAPPEPRT